MFEREGDPSDLIAEALQRTRPKCTWCGDNAGYRITYLGFASARGREMHETAFACGDCVDAMAESVITRSIDAIAAAWGDET